MIWDFVAAFGTAGGTVGGGDNKMIRKIKGKWMGVAAAAVVASPMMAKADGIADALTAAEGFETAVEAGTGAIIAVALVFVGVKLGKRLLSKI